jgi:hypothetical protein
MIVKDAASSKTTINISDYENGVYFVKISTNTNQIITKKFTVLK